MTVAQGSDARPALFQRARFAGLGAATSAAWRFWNTFARLIGHFAGDQGARFWGMVSAIVVSGFLYPLPLLLLVSVLRSAQSGQSHFRVGLHFLTLNLQHDAALLLVMAAGIFAILMHYAVARFVQLRTIAWQENVFWQLVGGLPECVRWDRPMNLGVPLLPYRVGNRLLLAARSGFLIGRLLETGLRDAALLAVAFAALIWLDAAAVLVLVYISLLFLPVYGLALSDLVRAQTRSAPRASRAAQALQEWLRSPLTTTGSYRIDRAAISTSLSEAVSPSISGGLVQIAGLSTVSAVAGIHLFAAFFAVFVADGSTLTALSDEKLFFFIVLLVLLRAMQGLIGLVSRLSRGYEGLGLLRDLLFPAALPMTADMGSEPAFKISFGDGLPQILRPGDRAVFLAPHFAYGYQLLPLLEVLQPNFDWHAIKCRHVPLLSADDLAGLGQPAAAGSARARTWTNGNLRLPLSAVSSPAGDAPVVAILGVVWQAHQKDPAVQAFLASRIVIVVVGPLQGAVAHAAWTKTNVPTILSDGAHVIGLGNFPAMLQRFQALHPKSTAVDGDDANDDETP